MLEYADLMFSIPTTGVSKAMRYPKHWGEVGNWYDVSIDDLAEQMRWIYENQETARQLTLEWREELVKRFDYDHVSKIMLETITKHYLALQ